MSLLSAQNAGRTGLNRITQAVFSTSTWYAFAGRVNLRSGLKARGLVLRAQGLISEGKKPANREARWVGESFEAQLASRLGQREAYLLPLKRRCFESTESIQRAKGERGGVPRLGDGRKDRAVLRGERDVTILQPASNGRPWPVFA